VAEAVFFDNALVLNAGAVKRGAAEFRANDQVNAELVMSSLAVLAQ
jgi:hypothetical protein